MLTDADFTSKGTFLHFTKSIDYIEDLVIDVKTKASVIFDLSVKIGGSLRAENHEVSFHSSVDVLGDIAVKAISVGEFGGEHAYLRVGRDLVSKNGIRCTGDIEVGGSMSARYGYIDSNLGDRVKAGHSINAGACIRAPRALVSAPTIRPKPELARDIDGKVK